MKNIFRKICFILAIAVSQLLFCVNVYAYNNVKNIDLDVLVHNDGSATINQMWTGTFDDGTENYIVISDKSLTIKNLSVSMDGHQFTYRDNWDINGSFDSKRYKCGINKTSEGVELCFGISKYGQNVYNISYDVMPLVKSYNDYDGFNFMFLNPDMSIYPSSAKFRLRMENGIELSENNAKIWGFGFNGDIEFYEGQVIAATSTPITSINDMIIMMMLEKGIINPSISTGTDFEEIRKKAFEGSEYEKYYDEGNLSFFAIIVLVLIGLCFLTPIIMVILYIRRIWLLNSFYKNCEYFRDTPNDGNMSLSHTLFNDFDIWNSKDSNVIAALIMKMIHDKNLEVMEDKTVGFFGIEKTNISLKIMSEPTEDTVKRLYNIIIAAAGDDGILQENELKKYASNNFQILDGFLGSITSEGHNALNIKKAYNKLLGKNLADLSDNGKKELAEVYGLRKYLDEFTLIDEREIAEVEIWENLLIYATLFGIANKVLKSLKNVYPDRIAEINRLSNTMYVSNSYYRALYYSSINSSRREAARVLRRAAGGMGGRVSMGGGGGFSGGGHGGGSR